MGQAGSGKSRILETFAEQLSAHGVPVLSMRCSDSAWAPFSAIKCLLDNHLAQLALLAPAEAEEITSALRTAAGPMAPHLRVLSPSLAKVFRDTEAVFRDGDAQEVFIDGLSTFLSKYLELIGRSALIIDDVHWLDDATVHDQDRIDYLRDHLGAVLAAPIGVGEDVLIDRAIGPVEIVQQKILALGKQPAIV